MTLIETLEHRIALLNLRARLEEMDKIDPPPAMKEEAHAEPSDPALYRPVRHVPLPRLNALLRQKQQGGHAE